MKSGELRLLKQGFGDIVDSKESRPAEVCEPGKEDGRFAISSWVEGNMWLLPPPLPLEGGVANKTTSQIL